MHKLDDLMYIVHGNELEFKTYLGGRVKNQEIEASILKVKKKKMAACLDRGYSFQMSARF